MSKDVKEFVFWDLFHLELGRPVLFEDMTKDVWIGADAVIAPFRAVLLTRRLPLFIQIPVSVLCKA